ncbi:MAG: alpha-ketoacid dehydrogenase subunit beta [Euzebyaceae bacterium]|jgi:pyruvate dehydrogenase E1 component beta subunit|nr:alpha-ketoacid dehydrogenase subunit beta [Euzebyaceae bacterium]
MAKLRMRQAIVAALADEMERDGSVIVFGEDVAAAGGPFKTSEGLLERFGRARVRDTPISETGFLGAGLGAAVTGLRPVVEIMFIEFLGVALDMLSTEAAKFRYLSGGKLSVPLVVRASAGSGLGFGAQHSQTLETWLYATPGLKLAVASGPRTAYGLLRAAVQDDNPVVVLEPRPLYGEREEVETGDAAVIPLGQANLCATGDDVTIVGLGQTVGTALRAAESAGWTADVIDLQTLLPWDRDTVFASVARTGRLVVVEESPRTGGWGTEIAAAVAGECFGDLTAPVTRITAPDVPVPFPPELEARYLPGPDYVRAQIDTLLDSGRLPVPWWETEGLGA